MMPRATIRHARIRVIFQWSLRTDTTASISATDDVRAANIARRKNAIPTISPPGMVLNTSGIVVKRRPNPLLISVLLENRTKAGTIISPDRKATQVSVRATVYADFSMLSCLRMYEP